MFPDGMSRPACGQISSHQAGRMRTLQRGEPLERGGLYVSHKSTHSHRQRFIIRKLHGPCLKNAEQQILPGRNIVMILERWFEEVWNKGNEAAIDELLAPDVIIHNLLGGDGEKVSDVPTFKKMFRAFRSALSEVHVTVEHELTEGSAGADRHV